MFKKLIFSPLYLVNLIIIWWLFSSNSPLKFIQKIQKKEDIYNLIGDIRANRLVAIEMTVKEKQKNLTQKAFSKWINSSAYFQILKKDQRNSFTVIEKITVLETILKTQNKELIHLFLNTQALSFDNKALHKKIIPLILSFRNVDEIAFLLKQFSNIHYSFSK